MRNIGDYYSIPHLPIMINEVILALNIKPDGTVTNTFIVGNDFRQISLLKSPKFSDSSVAGGFFKGTSSRVMRSMKAQTTTAAATLTIGREITDGSTPKIKAYIDDISDSSIFYHQNDSSGFGVFANSASISDGINLPFSEETFSIATVELTFPWCSLIFL